LSGYANGIVCLSPARESPTMSRRRDLLARSCPNCGASVDAEPVDGRISCRYCGQVFEAPREPLPEAPPRVVVIAPRAQPRVSAPRRAGGALLVLLLGGFLIAVRFGLLPGHTITTQILPLPQLPEPTAVSSFMWDSAGGPPIGAAVGGGAVEGFVGRIRDRGDDKLWIAAFDGSKLNVVWKAGPFGTYSEGLAATFFGVVGRDVVVTDYRAVLHIYDVASGREERTVKLSDRAKSMCAASDGKAHVWIEAKDEKNVLVDADLGTATSSPRPPWCPDSWGEAGDCRGWLRRGSPHVGCKSAASAPRVNGFEANNVLEEGDAAVALGKKHPGTALPMAVGFDPKSKAVRWQQPIASGDQASVAESGGLSVMDALAGGRFVAPYEITSKGCHFAALDAKTGQRLWDIALQPLIGVERPEGFTLSATRLYVMRTSSLEIYDAKTGALVGEI
jgi:putative pyrroloquinoline-quinone binding quinoprotein